MESERSYKVYQRQLADYCKTENLTDIPGIRSPARLETYRRLILSVFVDTLSRAYPITRKVLGEERFIELVKSFCAEYPSGSPQLWRMPRDLLDYVKSCDLTFEDEPFIYDLLEFEWVEIDVQMMADIKVDDYRFVEDCFSNILLVNPEHRVTQLTYPVFRLSVDDLRRGREHVGKLAGAYLLLTFRHPDTDEVHYSELSPLALLILQTLVERTMSGRDAIKSSLELLNVSINDENVALGKKILTQLCKNRAILGARVK